MLEAIASAQQCSVPQAALAWLLHQPAATNIILGASKMQHLEDNLGAVDVALTPEQLADLDAAMPAPKVYPHWFGEMTADRAHSKALQDG